MKRRLGWTLLTIAVLAGCSTAPKDTGPTLKSLEKKSVTIDRSAPVVTDVKKAKQSYEALLQGTDDEKLKQRAMRRLADLEIKDRTEGPAVDTAKTAPKEVPLDQPDYKKAITLYTDLLKSFPNKPDNDRIMYQLARAYELTGNIEKSFDVLSELVTKYPNSKFYEEAQFRRGELAFSFFEFDKAEKAYKESIRGGKNSPFYERASYKLGWSMFKQDKFMEALPWFFAVLDLKLGNKKLTDDVDKYEFLGAGDKEFVKDAFRVVSLCFLSTNGEKTVKEIFTKRQPTNYEFLVYRSLGDLHLKQERYFDAAASYVAFGDIRPYHPQALLLTIDAIELYQGKGNFDQVLENKKKLVTRYSKYVEYWATNTHYGFDQYLIRGNDDMDQRIESYVMTTLEELGKYYHKQAREKKNQLAYAEAVKWYQTYLRTFLQSPKAPEINMLMAEALYEDKRFAESIREFEKTAYNYNRHDKGADAGYKALLGYEEYKKTLSGEEKDFWDKLAIQSAQRFTKLYPKDPRASSVLAKIIDELYQRQDYKEATEFAKRVLAVAPDSEKKARLQATIILAHADFDEGKFDEAEKMYSSALGLLPPGDKNRAGLEDRLAASVYKQGEALKTQGNAAGAATMFLRVGQLVPTSTVAATAHFDAATAHFDAAAALLAAKDFAGAIPVLEDFQRKYPKHDLAPKVNDQLAVAYLESGDNVKAAKYLQTMAATKGDPNTQRDALWQSAELFEKGNALPDAIETYQKYIKQYPTPLDRSVEAHQKIIDLYGQLKQPSNVQVWQAKLVSTVKPDSPGATDRARLLAARAALAIAEPQYEDFHRIKLTAPLKQSIKQKKQAMDAALQTYDLAASYRIAEITTTSTYRIGQLYLEFSQEIKNSERPSGLSPEALEQYELALEEQSGPLEDKAIEVLQANVDRIATGVYDSAIRKSLAALGTLLPARYGKQEKFPPVFESLN